MMTKENIDLVY